MTEAEWLASNDPREMHFRVVKSLKSSRRRIDLFCLACVRLVWHLIEDQDAKQAFEWLDEHVGLRTRPVGGHVRDVFQGPARPLYDAHHRREASVSGAAIHVAYDFWADWYAYAFPNLDDYFANAPTAPYPGALRENPRTYLPAVMRDIFGNPFRPVVFSPSWRTDTAVALALTMYESREFSAMPILADAFQDAGCDNDAILNHCRNLNQLHVRGCWVIDLVLGKE